jgi:hypothetical protein
MKKLKPIPTFKTEADERRFWETHDSSDYLDLSKAERVRFSKPEALNDHDFNTSAAGFAEADQDRRQPARRALSVADQGVVG